MLSHDRLFSEQREVLMVSRPRCLWPINKYLKVCRFGLTRFETRLKFIANNQTPVAIVISSPIRPSTDNLISFVIHQSYISCDVI